MYILTIDLLYLNYDIVWLADWQWWYLQLAMTKNIIVGALCLSLTIITRRNVKREDTPRRARAMPNHKFHPHHIHLRPRTERATDRPAVSEPYQLWIWLSFRRFRTLRAGGSFVLSFGCRPLYCTGLPAPQWLWHCVWVCLCVRGCGFNWWIYIQWSVASTSWNMNNYVQLLMYRFKSI